MPVITSTKFQINQVIVTFISWVWDKNQLSSIVYDQNFYEGTGLVDGDGVTEKDA